VTAPYQRHSQTSRSAAESVSPALSDLHARVWAAVAFAGAEGLTDQEISQTTGLAENTVRPRRVELVRTGHFVAAGKRATASGRSATAWVCPENIVRIPGARVSPSARPNVDPHAPAPVGAGDDGAMGSENYVCAPSPGTLLTLAGVFIDAAEDRF
jgi:hypothetical protein